MSSPPVLILAGPTAVGKTRVALELAERFGAEIASADARQVYRGMDIGTAKATALERARVTHHLIDICDPSDTYSAARFHRDASAALGDITGRGHTPIVVGGTGLYLKVLREGLFEAPEITPEVRSEVDWILEESGREGLADYLREFDPETLAVIDVRNPARLRRAVEFHLQTRQSLESSRRRHGPSGASYRFYPVVLVKPRPQLYDSIEVRVHHMIASGWVEEVRQLSLRWDFRLPAFGAVGYREMEAVVNNRVSLEVAIARTVARTRQYAKRQLTWFTHQGQWSWMSAGSDVTAKIASGFAAFAENKSA